MSLPAAISLSKRPLRSGLVDSWRALACLAVVCFHGAQSVPDATTHPLVSTIATIGQFGWLGVPVFFVLSGYCLAQAIERRTAQKTGLIAFWGDRILRIYPVYWAALFLSIILALLAIPFNGLPWQSAFPSSLSAWLANLGLVTGWLDIPPRLSVSWSLDYEIGFYVFVGIALLAPLSAPLRRLGFYATFTLLAFMPHLPDWLPILRLWPQFACGIAVHTILQSSFPRLVRLVAGLYLIGLAVTFSLAHDPLAAFPSCFALLLLASLALEHHLPAPPASLVKIGLASYSIYLVHLPFMSPALNLAHRLLPSGSLAYAVAWLLHLALGIGAGLVFHHLVERRCEHFRTHHALS